MARSMINTLHTHSVIQATISATPSTILGVEDITIDPQNSFTINHAAGDHRPSYIALLAHAPVVTFSCSDIVTALTLINHLTGVGITGGTDTLDFYFAKKQSLGDRATGSNHIRHRTFSSLTWLEDITATQGAHAVARFRTVCLYDGTNQPLIPTGSVALPASIGNLTQKFKLGKWDVNGSNIDGVTSCTYRTGIEVEVNSGGGDHRPNMATITRRQPTIELTTMEIPYFTTLTPRGAKGTAAVSGYFYKCDEFGDVVADGTAEHIKITTQAATHRETPGAISVRNNENGSFSVTINPMYDGTNPETTISLASAVS